MNKESAEKQTSCICQDWKKSMPLIDGPIMDQFTRYGISYKGQQFCFCPWCGTALMGQDGEAKPDPIREAAMVYVRALFTDIKSVRVAHRDLIDAVEAVDAVDSQGKEGAI